MSTDNSIAKQLYPEMRGSFCVCDYGPIIRHLGDVLVQVDDDDYQGDTRVLLRKDGRYGVLIFGWGSCSGCDALQACCNYEQIDDLIEQLRNDIRWFATLEHAKAYVADDHANATNHWYHHVKWSVFKDDVLAYEDGGDK